MNLKLHQLTNIQLISLVERLDREIIALKVRDSERGVGAKLIRTPENYKVIDQALETLSDRPFSMNELFNEWLILTEQTDLGDNVTKNLRHHFVLLLTQNKFIVQTGGNKRNALYRVSETYKNDLANATELFWKCPSEQYNGTYLHVRVGA